MSLRGAEADEAISTGRVVSGPAPRAFLQDFFAKLQSDRRGIGDVARAQGQSGFQFFNGVRWSTNLQELKYLVRRSQQDQPQHLLESQEYRQAFYGQDLAQITAEGAISIKIQ